MLLSHCGSRDYRLANRYHNTTQCAQLPRACIGAMLTMVQSTFGPLERRFQQPTLRSATTMAPSMPLSWRTFAYGHRPYIPVMKYATTATAITMRDRWCSNALMIGGDPVAGNGCATGTSGLRCSGSLPLVCVGQRCGLRSRCQVALANSCSSLRMASEHVAYLQQYYNDAW
jgi:hypothetical protein